MTPPIRMVSVPVEPTEAMMLAADAVDWNNEDERGAVINMWQAMLTAAPVREEGGAVLANDLRCLKETFERIAASPPEDQPHYKSGVRPFGTGDLRHIIEVLTKAANPATVLALIAEVAALRETADVSRADRKMLSDMAVQNAARATEAERKLAEAVEIFARIARDHGIECIPDNEIHRAIRTFLSKEAERG